MAAQHSGRGTGAYSLGPGLLLLMDAPSPLGSMHPSWWLPHQPRTAFTPDLLGERTEDRP